MHAQSEAYLLPLARGRHRHRQSLRGTRASSTHLYWKKFRCFHRLVLVSCVRQSLPHCGQPKRFPASKSSFKSSWRGSPSNRHSLTFHPAPSCRAAVNNTSGVIGPILFPLAKDLQGPAMRPLFLVNRVLRELDSKKIMLDHPFTTAGNLILTLTNHYV